MYVRALTFLPNMAYSALNPALLLDGRQKFTDNNGQEFTYGTGLTWSNLTWSTPEKWPVKQKLTLCVVMWPFL